MTSDNTRHRLGLLAVAALSLFGALFARLWFLQLVEGDTLRLEAQGNSTEVVITPADRGRILDRNATVLVGNRESIVVGIDAQEFDDLPMGQQVVVLDRLTATLNASQPTAEPLTRESIRKKLNDTRYTRFRPIPVADDISVEDEIYFSEQQARYPSVVVERTTVRDYPYGSLAAHVLGYVGPLSEKTWAKLERHNDEDKPYVRSDEIGKAGVESEYEQYLRGTPGRRVYEIDRTGKIVREIESERTEPTPGDDVYLALDARIQAETEKALRTGLDERRSSPGELGMYPAEAGASTVIDPRNGQVLAMASYPTYDPRELVGGIPCPTWRDLQGLPAEGQCGDAMGDEVKLLTKAGTPPVAKLLNRAIQGVYPAGSTFKLASSFAGIELGLTHPNDTINDPGYYLVPGCTGDEDACRVSSPSAESGGVGPVNLERALTVSSDTYYYSLGNNSWALYKQDGKVGPDAFQKEVEQLGYGKETGIDLGPERPGVIPTPESLKELDIAINGGETEAGRWQSGNSINMAVGQGQVLVTPLQNANAYAAFANGGTLYRPSVLDHITKARQADKVVKAFAPKTIRTIDWGPAHADMLRGFEGVTQSGEGTAHPAFEGFPFDIWSPAGKTGTAETGTKDKPKEDHSWFVGFGPSGGSLYVDSTIMEHSGAGGSAAAPAVRKVFEVIANNALPQVDLFSVSSPAATGSEASSADGATADGTGTTDGSGTTGTTGTTGN